MKYFKNLNLKKILLSVLFPLVLALAIVGGTLFAMPAKALSSYQDTTTITNPLYSYSTHSYDKAMLDLLGEKILGTGNGIKELISYIKNEALTYGKPVPSKTITLRYGRARSAESDSYKDLIWMPVYMSTTNEADKKDRSAVLTLYLITANGSFTRNEYSAFSYGGYYNNDASSLYPSNMYGRSYVRSYKNALANAGLYYKYDESGKWDGSTSATYTTYESSNKYIDFQMYTYENEVDGKKVDVVRKGYLYDDIVAPSKMEWQKDESYAKVIGDKGTVYYNDGNGSNNEHGGSDWENYVWPNEAYGIPSEGNYYNFKYFDYGGMNGSSSSAYIGKRDGYDDWKDDKVWLPSLTEVGTGDVTGEGNELNGLWQLTRSQRSNYDGKGSPMAAQAVAWLRTANTIYHDNGNDYSTRHMFVLEADGTVGTRPLNETPQTIAIRPAIHLNLDNALKKVDPPVNLPDTVTVPYIGEVHQIGVTTATSKTEQLDSVKSWFSKGDMNVRFAYDSEMTKMVFPVNAGSYYMEVTLENGSLRFVDSDPANPYRKVVKFVIEKAKIGVKWTYREDKDNYIPTAVKISDKTVIYERDKLADNVPQIGMLFRSITTSSRTFTDFNELTKDGYYTEAYIIDEDLYNYNYVLSDEIDEPIKFTYTFVVGRKIIPIPEIADAGTPKKEQGINVYSISYQGVQYIQLVNVSKYLLVSVTASDGNTIECLNPMTKKVTNSSVGTRYYPAITDDGTGYGTLTYKIQKGALKTLYTFNFSFESNKYFTWDENYVFESLESESGVDTADKQIQLNVGRANLELEFVGLPGEWLAIQSQTFTVNARGLYERVDEMPLRVYYMYEKNGNTQELEPVNGVYKLENLLFGKYTLYASLATNSHFNDLYLLETGAVAQKFEVLEAVSNFKENLVQWQYTHNGVTNDAGNFIAHDSPESAMTFEYDGDYYIFSLTISEDTLRDEYYVKAVYSGSKFVKDAGAHSITVSIRAYYKNVTVEEKDYTLYFTINPARYDLSQLEWDDDYSHSLVYNGKVQTAILSADSLAKYPGLTAEYVAYVSTGGGLTADESVDAGEYRAKAVFLVSNEYAKNYIVPKADDSESYTGTFDFYHNYEIAKATLNLQWVTSSGSTSLLFVPVLKNSSEYVRYYYEVNNASGWTSADDLVASATPGNYRVGVTLLPQYSNNFELSGDTTCEFTIESGKQPIVVHFEDKNGNVLSDGEEFKYTSDSVELSLVIDFTDGMSLQTYTLEYFKVVGGSRQSLGSVAPYDIGEYVAVVSASYSSGGYISEVYTSEISFKIIKGDFDPNQIYWLYSHGDTEIWAKWDAGQEKWVDDYGKEVIFAFEYDGTEQLLTVECLQQFTHPEDNLKVASYSGTYSAISASNYTAVVNFEYNSSRFNNPTDATNGVFPRSLSWTITKKQINYNEVRWGYILNGQERDFNFDTDEFRYTRDENGVVSYTVALIGLPKGVQDLMAYTTKNLSIANSAATAGNSRAAVGEYLTSFTVSGTWTDPTGNYEDFDASTFPLSIPTSQVWTIKCRELAKINYNNSWTEFDDRTHDLLEICRIPYDELNYLDIEITFIDSELYVYNNYEGYNGVANSLYHAGVYTVRLYELTTSIKDGAEVEERIVWDSYPINVDKAEVEVSWDTDGGYPVARASSAFSTDVVTTVYYRKSTDAEVPLAYVKSTSGEESFYAKARVSDDYKQDVNVIYAAGQDEKVDFTYTPFTPLPGAVSLAFPELVLNPMEYTGNPLTFAIKDWESKYKSYLYISAGSLTQTDIGEYSVVLRFKSDANAYWSKTVVSGEYNRDAYTLPFSIVEPTRWPIEYPRLDSKEKPWDNNEEVEFVITNWVELSKYLTYEVFGPDKNSLGENVKLFFRQGGNYKIVFTIADPTTCYFKDSSSSTKYTLSFRIDGDPNEPITEIPLPELSKITEIFTGYEIEFVILNWEYYSKFVDVTCANATVYGGIITAVNALEYTAVFRIKNGLDVTFEDGTTEYSITFSIIKSEGPGNVENLPKPTLNSTQQSFTGGVLEFAIPNWSTLYKDYLEINFVGGFPADAAIDSNKGIIKVTAIGTYNILVSIKDVTKAKWADGTTEAVPLSFEVLDASKIAIPYLETDSLPYNGKDQTFVLVNLNTSMVTVNGSSLIQRDVNDYNITLTLKDKENYTWADGTTADITLHFEITKAKLPDGSHIGVDKDGNPQLQDKDGNPWPDFDFDFGGLFDIEFVDKETGEVVSREDLVPGKTYYVKLIPNAKYDSSVDDPNGEKLPPTEGPETPQITPAAPPSKRSLKSWEIALIVVAAVLALLAVIVVIIIVVLKSRKNNDDDYNNYNDGYSDGYDDYDDFDDDFDDDDFDDDDFGDDGFDDDDFDDDGFDDEEDYGDEDY